MTLNHSKVGSISLVAGLMRDFIYLWVLMSCLLAWFIRDCVAWVALICPYGRRRLDKGGRFC